MCGIAGIFNYADPGRPVDRALLERMTRALAHRGPDGEGFYVDGPVGLGHRRLAIVDLTPTGAQPMANEDRTSWITYNGEFYDHLRHRPALQAKHLFRGTSDTETLLHLLEQRGPDALAEISAIFGLAYWDGRRRTLLLARDPLGVKQVYFHDDGERILFASEIKALLLCSDVARDIDPEAVNQYLHFHTPLFERTFFKAVRQLRPAEYLEVSAGGRTRRKRYWAIDDFSRQGGTSEENVASLREQLAEVVRDQLMADVPVGAFFSGGIDSSAVAQFARRAGKPPQCFGVHFTGQGVIDEAPYQEAAARALGLELELTTLDGSSFPEDLERALFHQDQPVIGAAMLPMYHVSRLASRHVKVCLGGQAADEIFGGYARYALAHPIRSAFSIFSRAPRDGGQSPAPASVGGNLLRQLADRSVLRRLAHNARNFANWRELYFQNFAKVPEAAWRDIIDGDDLVSREGCRHTFLEELAACPAPDPATKLMYWDTQTYLPGLFQQDDRMSMANGLESRVPLADPRLVRFAFRIPLELKIRSGATKWILRQAVADVLPKDVLTRRKVGFSTPADRWMKEVHPGFVREMLLSTRARQRGLWKTRGLARWLDDPGRQVWFDVVWKALCIEEWARLFLDAAPAESTTRVPSLALEEERAPYRPHSGRAGLRHWIRELRELGLRGSAFRARWEFGLRSGLAEALDRPPLPLSEAALPTPAEWIEKLPFAAPEGVTAALENHIHPTDRSALAVQAEQAASGKIHCFGRWVADYGQPLDWQLNPVNGRRWNPKVHWSRALEDEARVGDVKLTWEVARFPHAYQMGRAAAWDPGSRDRLAGALAGQIDSFLTENPYGLGIHWASSQEIVLRLMAWLFALAAMGPGSALGSMTGRMAQALHEAAVHLERNLEYARKAVYNNHLLSEALGLFLAGTLLPRTPRAARWRGEGLALLTQQADVQVFPDGAYIQQSHNYHRVAMQVYLWAAAMLRKAGEPIPAPWRAAMERSLDFLYSQQNPTDGRLPNYGSNDGALPSIFTTCDFSDFRPVLQTLSVLLRGRRLYDPGPWDEQCAWLLGPRALEAPLEPRARRSVSFDKTGYHVLRGHDPANFASLRCGTVKDRFSQIDMLALDVFWRGENVLVDGGSYLYNGPQKWHDHFLGTASHNTVMVDGRDQMFHYRRFKCLYWTKAELLAFSDREDWALCEGEHHGYARHPGACVHRRSVLFAKDDLWVVVDRVSGRADSGEHQMRLHWLGGEYPHSYDPNEGRVTLETPAGPFEVSVLGSDGRPRPGDVVAGCSHPPRGWVSRYYGEKRAAPSLVVEQRGPVPLTVVTLLSPESPRVAVSGDAWTVLTSRLRVRFRIDGGRFSDISVDRSSSPS